MKLVFFLYLLSTYCSYSQPLYDNFKVIPASPEPARKIKIEYTPIAHYLTVGASAFVFFCEPLERWAKAVEVPMVREGEKLSGTIISAERDVAFLIVFIDSLGNTIDNNNGEGYWSPLFQNGETIPGSLASVARLYYGFATAGDYKIKPNRDLAKQLFDQDFRRKPDLKRFYYCNYINSIRYENDPVLWRSEVDRFSTLQDLDEWELEYLSQKFESVKDTAKAKKFKREIAKKFPQGHWVLQQISITYMRRFFESQDVLDKIKAITDQREKFASWPKNEDNKRYFEATTLVAMYAHIEEFVRSNKVTEWRSLTDSMRPHIKFAVFYLAAKSLYEKKIFLALAEELAKEAVEWKEQNLSAPRVYIEWKISSDREIRFKREKELSEWLEAYGSILRLQSKNEEARFVFEKAALYGTHQVAKLRNRPLVKLISELPPSISFFDSNKKAVSLDQLKGKIVVLDFWASWCGPCISGFKKMSELEKQYGNKNLIFLFVNTQEKGTDAQNRKRAKEILKQEGYYFTVLFDPQSRSTFDLNFDALPTAVVIDKEGFIRFKHTGSGDYEGLVEAISMLMGNSNLPSEP